jgi:HAD superfamily hydrolase (TIGR01509 family)
MIRSVIFDYNGVLVNDLDLHEKAYVRAAKECGLQLEGSTVRRYISTTPEQKRGHFFGEISDQVWARVFDLKTKYYFQMAKEKVVLSGGVRDLLLSLSRKYVLGLISNTPRRYFEAIFPPDLAGLFRETIFGDEMTSPKPSSDPLLEMIKRFGLNPGDCCYVGDSVSDVLMARAAGVRIFAVTTGDNSRQELEAAGAASIMENLAELEERLEAIDLEAGGDR